MNTSSTTQLKTLRLKNESIEFFKGKPLNRYVEDMQSYIESGDIEETEKGIKVLRTKGLKDACRPRLVDPQELIDKLTNGLNARKR